MQTPVDFEIKDQIAIIALNRIDAMNTYNDDMANTLNEIIQSVASDNSIRAVQLKGAGDCFCAGGDVKFFHENIEALDANIENVFIKLNETILTMQTMKKPIISVVHGAVAGVGIGFMLASDIIIAADNTIFNLAYTRIGATPDGGITYLLPRAVGMVRAKELLLLSKKIDARTAHAYGLVTQVCPLIDVFKVGDTITELLAQGATGSFGQVKSLLFESFNSDLSHQLVRESKQFSKAVKSEDFKKGVHAFVSKTAADFKGA